MPRTIPIPELRARIKAQKAEKREFEKAVRAHTTLKDKAEKAIARFNNRAAKAASTIEELEGKLEAALSA